MISQERKDQLKSEGEEGELQDKIRGYNKIFQRRKFIPLIATIYTFGMLLYYSGMLLYNSDMEPFSFPPEIIFTLLLFYLGFIVITRYFINRILMESSQPMAYYAAVSAAEQLDNDNLIEASFCADKLLEALSFLVKKKSIKVKSGKSKSWKSSLKNLLYVQPRDIKNKAVHGAIQDSTATKNVFAEQFYDLADSLSKAHLTSREFMAIRDFLEWLRGKSQTYEREIGFWARHQNYTILIDIMAIITPLIVAILMLIDYWLIPAM